MLKVRKITVIFCYSIIFATLVGCNTNRTVAKDDSILTQTPCKFPCWHSLTPGQSTISDVQAVIGKDVFITSAEQVRQGVDGIGRTVFQWWYDTPQRQNRILIENNLIDSIEISPNLPFTLEEVVSKYGEPDAINARLERSNEGGEIDASLFLFYPQLGLEIEFRIPGGNTLTTDRFDIESTTPGLRFRLFRPQDSLNGFIAEAYQVEGEELNNFIESATLTWPGFDGVIVVNSDYTSFYDQTFIITETPS